jgi:hypothetical protein
MASQPSSSSSALPPDLFDKTTLISLASTLAIVLIAYLASRIALPRSSTTTTTTIRFLFIWHLADALCHFLLEGSFLYHCFFSSIPVAEARRRGILADLVPTPYNFLGREDGAIYGPQSGGDNPFAQLWMVYARADRRWAGADLVSLSFFSFLLLLLLLLLFPTIIVASKTHGKRDRQKRRETSITRTFCFIETKLY